MLQAALGGQAAAVAAPAVAAPAAVVAAAAVPFVAAIAAAAAAAPVMAAVVPGDEIGCKLDVWKGRAVRTRGGLMKQHLKLNRIGRVVSIKASNAAKNNNNLGNFQVAAKD
jgi:capsid protein